MDPITAVGAVASIITLAQTALSLSKTLYTLGEAVASASDDVHALADDLKTFSQSLTLLSRLLEDSKSWYSDDVYLLTAKIIKDCAELYVKIDTVLAKLGGNGKSNWRIRVKFVYKEGQIRKLMKRLRDMKGTLATILMSLQVDLQLSLLNISSSSKIQRAPENPLQPETVENLRQAQQAVEFCGLLPKYFGSSEQPEPEKLLPSLSSNSEQSELFTTSNETLGYHQSNVIHHGMQSFAKLPSASQESKAAVVKCRSVTGPVFASLATAPGTINRAGSAIAMESASMTAETNSLKSASSIESFKSAVSEQIIAQGFDFAHETKEIKGLLHAFGTALDILKNLIQRRIQDRRMEVYNVAKDLGISLASGEEEVRRSHKRNCLKLGKIYVLSWTNAHCSEVESITLALMKEIVMALHMYSAEHEELKKSEFMTLLQQSEEIRTRAIEQINDAASTARRSNYDTPSHFSMSQSSRHDNKRPTSAYILENPPESPQASEDESLYYIPKKTDNGARRRPPPNVTPHNPQLFAPSRSLGAGGAPVPYMAYNPADIRYDPSRPQVSLGYETLGRENGSVHGSLIRNAPPSSDYFGSQAISAHEPPRSARPLSSRFDPPSRLSPRFDTQVSNQQIAEDMHSADYYDDGYTSASEAVPTRRTSIRVPTSTPQPLKADEEEEEKFDAMSNRIVSTKNAKKLTSFELRKKKKDRMARRKRGEEVYSDDQRPMPPPSRQNGRSVTDLTTSVDRVVDIKSHNEKPPRPPPTVSRYPPIPMRPRAVTSQTYPPRPASYHAAYNSSGVYAYGPPLSSSAWANYQPQAQAQRTLSDQKAIYSTAETDEHAVDSELLGEVHVSDTERYVPNEHTEEHNPRVEKSTKVDEGHLRSMRRKSVKGLTIANITPASSRADNLDAKITSAVEMTLPSDSEETFVYESDPPDSSNRPRRFHSQTPTATSIIHVEQKQTLESPEHEPLQDYQKQLMFLEDWRQKSDTPAIGQGHDVGIAKANAEYLRPVDSTKTEEQQKKELMDYQMSLMNLDCRQRKKLPSLSLQAPASTVTTAPTDQPEMCQTSFSGNESIEEMSTINAPSVNDLDAANPDILFESSPLGDFAAPDREAWVKKKQAERRQKRRSLGSVQKRTFGQDIGSDTDEEDVQPAFEGADEAGSSARRLRRKGKDDRTSLIFDDPHPRIKELEEPENEKVAGIKPSVDEKEKEGQGVDWNCLQDFDFDSFLHQDDLAFEFDATVFQNESAETQRNVDLRASQELKPDEEQVEFESPLIAPGLTQAGLEKKPLFINPKQFHGIIRRRLARQKLYDRFEFLPRRPRPIPHGSHAMRRPRGPDGRFLTAEQLAKQAREKEAAKRATTSNDRGTTLQEDDLISSPPQLWWLALISLPLSDLPTFNCITKELLREFRIHEITSLEADKSLCKRISTRVGDIASYQHANRSAVEEIVLLRNNIIRVVTTIDQQLGLDIAVIGWGCVCVCLSYVEVSLSCPVLRDSTMSAITQSLTELQEIVGIIARYAVMENLYQQSGGALSLKSEYKDELFSLCSTILEYFSAFFALNDKIYEDHEDLPTKSKRCEELAETIRAKDKACKGFRVVVDMKEESDNDSDSEEAEIDDLSDGSWDHVRPEDGLVDA